MDDWLTITEPRTATAAWLWLRESWPWLLVPAIPDALFGAWWLWWRLPKRQAERLRMTIRDAKARADVEDNFRKTIGQLLGGIAVLLGAGLAYLQFQGQQQASRNLLISNQVAKGFELLGNKEKNITLRLGGIYALEGVMNTSEEYHKPVLEALSAFVRENAKKPAIANTPSPAADLPATDIQAALTVIGRRKVPAILAAPPAVRDRSRTHIIVLAPPAAYPAVPDLSNAHIPQANLTGANLTGADLSEVNLTGGNLIYVHLTYADLSEANLTGAILTSAKLSGARLTGAHLAGANLIYANLTGASLTSANLTEAALFEANLSGGR